MKVLKSIEEINGILAGKTLLIIGGTGSFGNAVLRHFLKSDIHQIRIFSRDELKQDDMRHYYEANYPEYSDKIRYYIGNVTDINSIRDAMYGVDFVFHAAALKQVPSCEFFPLEAVKTNVLGTENVLTAAIEAGVKRIVCLSTDKAAYPINAMGTSKAMMEKVIVAKSRTVKPEKTAIMCTRYGNVMYSRGSVLPLFVKQMNNGQQLTLTDPNMTRFIMSLDEAVNLVAFAFKNGNTGDILVQKASATSIQVLADAMKKLFKYDKPDKIIGLRHGEKTYETLLTNEECFRAIDMGDFYRVPCDNRGLNYDNYIDVGTERNGITEFNSNNTKLLNVDETIDKLLEINEIREAVKAWEQRNNA